MTFLLFLKLQAEQCPPPKDVHVLIPKACEYVALHGVRDLAGMIKSRLLRKIMLDYPGGLNIHPKLLMRGRQGGLRQRGGVAVEAEVGVMHPEDRGRVPTSHEL